MSSRTSFDNLYSVLGAVVAEATGRPWWRKAGIQSRPVGPYATIYVTDGQGLETPVVEMVELELPGPLGETIEQAVWGTTTLQVVVEFLKDAANNTALQAATRLKNAFYLEARYDDLWEIAALSGGVKLVDVSSIFRADIEPRAEVRFQLVANIADPIPLAGVLLDEISSVGIGIGEEASGIHLIIEAPE